MDGITLKRVDVFTTTPFAGNPAGVVTRADSLGSAAMQSLASEMKLNLIETAYLTGVESEGPVRVRFFSPDTELEFSGHVMIAACFALIEEGSLVLQEGLTRATFQTRMGEATVDIHSRSDCESGEFSDYGGEGLVIESGANRGTILERIMILQPSFSFKDCDIPAADLAGVLGIDASDISSTGLPVIRVCNEIEWLIIPVRDKDVLSSMRPDLIKLGMLNKRHGTFSNQVFTLDTFDPACICYSRNFSPAMGLWEDPASASGSAGLGAYLSEFGITASDSMVMQQGNETENLTRILVENDGASGGVKVGGLAVKSIERKLEPSIA